jgi:hypothetical protein
MIDDEVFEEDALEVEKTSLSERIWGFNPLALAFHNHHHPPPTLHPWQRHQCDISTQRIS